MAGYPPYYPVSHDGRRFYNPANPHGARSIVEGQFTPSPELARLAEEYNATLEMLGRIEYHKMQRLLDLCEFAKTYNTELQNYLKQIET